MRSLLLTVTLLVVLLGPEHIRAQLQSEELVVLEGILQIGTFYGPPNYGENPESDRLETSYYLQLFSELHVDELAVPEDARPLPGWIYLVHIVSPSEDSPARVVLRESVGKRVRISGSLMAAHTGHHRSPVLLIAKQVERVEP